MSMRFRRVLFPTDFSDSALLALPDASAIASASEGQLYCIHVVDDAYQYWSAFGPEGMPVGPRPDELLGLGRARMEKFASEHLTNISPAVITHVALGRPFAEIIGYAREQAIDMIVMSTHGRGAIAHMLLGSTAEKIVRKSGCAVLTIRGSTQSFVMP